MEMDDFNSDEEMECDFINRPTEPPCNTEEITLDDSVETSTPVTPPHTLSNITSDICSTPSFNSNISYEASFIKRVGLDRNLFRPRCRPTSTPFMLHSRLSHTLPNSSLTSNMSPFADLRNCKSAEQFRPPNFDPDHIPYELINPFTPDGKILSNKINAQKKLNRVQCGNLRKFELTDTSESDGQSNNDSDIEVPSRPRLTDFNVSRFNEEFVQLKQIGKGVHGCVYKCLNRMNGCIYAIKRTIKPIKSSLQERTIRNEIYAHGVLDHQNIVRNYSCWKEDGYVFIQNEYCNGGSLEEYIQSNTMSEALLHNLLLQMAHALRYIHRKGLAHLDIKPGNIFLSIDKNKENSFDSDGGYSDDDKFEDITFKLGDLGHITKLDEQHDVEEGDCRYLPREILEEKFEHLDRADIFALGLTVFEAAGGGPLPKNGDEWQEIRNGNLKYLDQLSKDFNNILKNMVLPVPENRPSAADLIQLVKPNPPSPLPTDVFDYIQQYRHNNTRLEHKVETTDQYLRVLVKSHKQLQEQLGKDKKVNSPAKDRLLSLAVKKKACVSKTRVVGKKTKRSSSTIF